MEYELDEAISILERTPKVLRTLLSGLPNSWIENNEGPDTWSPFDIVGHLIHGEKTDWIPRLKLMKSDDADKTFPPFDRFAQFEASKGKSLDTLLEEFEQLRADNIVELKFMSPNENELDLVVGIHPALGNANARQLLSTWVVHDLGHIAQISRVMAKQYKSEVGPWKAYLGILQK